MKKLFFVLMLGLTSITFFSCADDDTSTDAAESILGRWHPEGFEDSVLYEFTATKRYTMYSTDGTFPSLEEFLLTSNGAGENDWYYEGATLVIDLNFGNFQRVIPNFKCGNYAVDFEQESDGSDGGTLFREGYDPSGCN